MESMTHQQLIKILNTEFNNRIRGEMLAIKDSYFHYGRQSPHYQYDYVNNPHELFEVFVYEEEGMFEHAGMYWGRSTYNKLMSTPMVELFKKDVENLKFGLDNSILC